MTFVNVIAYTVSVANLRHYFSVMHLPPSRLWPRLRIVYYIWRVTKFYLQLQLDNMWGALGQSFHTGQIHAARYPITPLLTSKVVNFCAYFRHLCIIEKRRPLQFPELLVSYGSPRVQQKVFWILGCSQSAMRGRATTATRDRPPDV